jgi:hypothetical protein
MSINRLVTKSFLENNKRSVGPYSNIIPFPAYLNNFGMNNFVNDDNFDAEAELICSEIKESFEFMNQYNRCKFYQAEIEKFSLTDKLEVKYKMKEVNPKNIKIAYDKATDALSFGFKPEDVDIRTYLTIYTTVNLSFLYIELPGEVSTDLDLSPTNGLLVSSKKSGSTYTFHMAIGQGDFKKSGEIGGLSYEVDVENMAPGLSLIVES